jgi:hypothetical protein
MSRENVAAARSRLAAFNEDRIGALLDHLDPQIEWVSVRGCLPDAEDRVGHHGVRDWFDTITELIHELQWETLEFIDAADQGRRRRADHGHRKEQRDEQSS